MGCVRAPGRAWPVERAGRAGRTALPPKRFRMLRGNATASTASVRGQATTRRDPFESRRAARLVLDRLPAGRVERLTGNRRYLNAE
ncbi:hypothetical protein DIE23_09930 [Burkholderia sp. Bp9143]|nr:hypothetical protein DIE23_09930 [Burkholderia sp. Bp9143]